MVQEKQILQFYEISQIKNNKYYNLGRIIQKFNGNIVETDKIDTPNAHVHDRSLSWLGKNSLIKSSRVRLVICVQTSLSSIMGSCKCFGHITDHIQFRVEYERGRFVPHVEQELLTFLEHLSSPPVFSGIPVARSLVFSVMFCRSLIVLLSFLLAIMLSVLRFTASDYLFGIFKLFL